MHTDTHDITAVRCDVRAERKRQQLARRIAKLTQSNQAPQGSTTGAEPRAAVVTTPLASDDDGGSGGGIVITPADGVVERGAVRDTESMGGAGKRTRRRRQRQPGRQVDYSEEALAERMAHLLSQRQVTMRSDLRGSGSFSHLHVHQRVCGFGCSEAEVQRIRVLDLVQEEASLFFDCSLILPRGYS